MTKKFDEYYEQVLSEVLVGSKKRNKLNEDRSMTNITPNSRSVKKGMGLIKLRTRGQANQNTTGKVSKQPNTMNVYKTKHVSKRKPNTEFEPQVIDYRLLEPDSSMIDLPHLDKAKKLERLMRKRNGM